MTFLRIEKIVSGGQTGADRAALDFAIEYGIPHGGWCPRGRLAEDGRIDDRYQLTETASERYEQRTEKNVEDSDATVIFSLAKTLTAGSGLTAGMARKHKKPCLHLSEETMTVAEATVALILFLTEHHVRILNVAGPRASTEPEVGAFVEKVLSTLFSNIFP